MTRAAAGKRGLLALGLGGATLVIGLLATSTTAFERYNDGCQNCHGEFTGPDSPKGTQFPNDDKHSMHRSSSWMNTECDLCHTDGDGRNPFLGSSNGTAINPGVGCTGCHGRDYGGMIGNSGVGLRAHHFINDVTSCAGCHPDDPAPLPESVNPTYYGTVDTNANDACNEGPMFLENWSIGDTEGNDNDGDNLYDALEDPDCATCGAAGDYDSSGCVDFADINAIIGRWGCTGDPCGDGSIPFACLDGDGSGEVDFGDLNGVLANWGNGCGGGPTGSAFGAR